MKSVENTIAGKLHLFSETGTEGGYWALQDSRFIDYVKPEWGLFEDTEVVDPDNLGRVGIVAAATGENGAPFTSSTGRVVIDALINWRDGTTELRKSDTLLVESWSYDGLVLLRNEDELTIFDKDTPEKVVWHGLVKLISHDEETVGPTLLHPFRLHHDQVSVDQNEWANWFFRDSPAQLIRPSGFTHVIDAEIRKIERSEFPVHKRNKKSAS